MPPLQRAPAIRATAAAGRRTKVCCNKNSTDSSPESAGKEGRERRKVASVGLGAWLAATLVGI